MIPHRTPFFLPLIYPSLLWRMPESKNDLYLTFDDGPVPGPTEFVLDELERFSAKATFFCIGDNIRKHPDVFTKLLASGHAVGNHTFNHLNGWKTNNTKYLDNIKLVENTLASLNTAPTTLFRPPYGRVTFSQIRALHHYRIVMWDVLTKDYDHSLDTETCFKRSVAATRAGSIVLFHDSFKAEKNLRSVLPRFLRHFTDLGYSFKAIPS